MSIYKWNQFHSVLNLFLQVFCPNDLSIMRDFEFPRVHVHFKINGFPTFDVASLGCVKVMTRAVAQEFSIGLFICGYRLIFVIFTDNRFFSWLFTDTDKTPVVVPVVPHLPFVNVNITLKQRIPKNHPMVVFRLNILSGDPVVWDLNFPIQILIMFPFPVDLNFWFEVKSLLDLAKCLTEHFKSLIKAILDFYAVSFSGFNFLLQIGHFGGEVGAVFIQFGLDSGNGLVDNTLKLLKIFLKSLMNTDLLFRCGLQSP